MRFQFIVVGILATLALGGCKKGGDDAAKGEAQTTSAGSALADGFRAVPNLSGLQAKVPSKLVPNGLGGAAGFHEEGGGGVTVSILEVTGDELQKSFDDAKSGVEELLFKKWISADKTEDGWVLLWEEEPMEGLGGGNSFQVRKTVGKTTYRCYGSAKDTADLSLAADVCKSLKSL